MPRLLLVLLLLLCANTATAQKPDDRAAVTSAALDFYEGDTTKLVRSIRPDVFKYGYFVRRGKTAYEGERMTWEEFLEYARKFKAANRTTPATAPKKVE